MRVIWVKCGLALLLAGVFAIAVTVQLWARDDTAPKGVVILTIAGDIGKYNRGSLNPKRDGFLNYHEISFERAFEFDRSMLDGLKQGTVKAHTAQTGKPVTLKGAVLSEALKLAGVRQGASISTLALDGFRVEITAQDLAARDWVLVTTIDGKPLGIGAQGPIWLLHTPSRLKVPENEEQGWPWAVFFIEVKQ